MKKSNNTLTMVAGLAVAWWLLRHRAATGRDTASEVLDNATEPLIAPERERVGKLSDPVVSVDNIYRGVRRGWYKATLCVVDGKPCVRLSGTVNNKPYSDVYRVSDWEAWNFMKMDGFPVE